jgi:hypothetical protein
MGPNSDAGPSAEIDRILASLRDPLLRGVASYWRGKLRQDRLPGRHDIDPIEIPQFLSHLYLIEIERDPERFRHRLIGTQIAEWAGRDATGTYVDELDYGPHRSTMIAEYREVAARGLPRCDDLEARWPNPDYKFYTRLLCPLATDGHHVDMLFCALNVHKGERPAD